MDELAVERAVSDRPKIAVAVDKRPPLSKETAPAADTSTSGLFKRLTNGFWAAPPHAAAETNANPDRPLIDIALIAGSVWQVRYVVRATTVLGAVGGIMLAMSTSPAFIAQSKLYIDPREVRLTDSDLSKESFSTEAILALVDSQTQVLRSPAVLAKVAIDLGLERDGEFGTSAGSGGGFLDGVKVIREVLSPPGKPVANTAAEAAVDPRVVDNLAEAITVFRDPKTFIVTVEVKSHDAAKSARIANSVVATFLDEEQSAQSSFYQRTTEALDSRLAELRRSLDEAENAVEKYKADHDIIGANGELIADKQLLALSDQVAVVRSRISDARAKAEIVSRVDADAVLTGSFPEEIISATISELRKQYSAARAQLGALDASLGPRHPQRLAAAQALDVARSEVGNELRRIAASNRTELERAQKAEQDLLRQLAVQKTQQVSAAGSFIELREMERKAAATRALYESFLKRASETGEEEKLTAKNIRVISPAQPPLASSGTSRKTIVIIGVVLGFLAGIGLGVLLGILRSLRLMLATPSEDETIQAKAPILPPDGGDNDRGHRSVPRQEPEYTGVRREAVPSQQYADASAAALSVLVSRGLPAQLPDEHDQEVGYPEFDPDVAHLQEELRALRSRVEEYSRYKTALRRQG
ncbi:uncharacterized protein involved in exopolysaccharide biosynthesis [Pararhizobium capsulatum DSM 1112]|uniref:Uncharacterized protein involved in exopolysaccharide biosynthesis n=1 Tax=Pararhizobium capsulatum DSM 1112 TaxID=1121113 RepID=A0ABU0BMJ7_9HYPH|nr:hypothetical protein [Pararhizobium capsulatum]MDQ0319187.1 uncharacterized protein involved in exopolysaccharide biosynthesis [Pararhizobium capsulatum DSM 1112]